MSAIIGEAPRCRRIRPTTAALRFLTAGSVDDGKSTLIGRLLYDSRAILADQLACAASARRSRRGRGDHRPVAAHRRPEAEREQGITIDVAYRYFATARASSSSPTRPATSSTRATWSPPVLDRQLDISRGDWIASAGQPRAGAALRGHAGVARHRAAVPGRKYWLRHGNRWVQARITAIVHRLDIHTLQPTDAHELAVNEIGHVVVELQQPLPVEPYDRNRVGGALIVVDPASQPHQRCAAGARPA
jgi:sulfate adenylyltransferase subunit 1 (EFTu-like GTPase family)